MPLKASWVEDVTLCHQVCGRLATADNAVVASSIEPVSSTRVDVHTVEPHHVRNAALQEICGVHCDSSQPSRLREVRSQVGM